MIVTPEVRLLLVAGFLILVIGIGLMARLQFSGFAHVSTVRLCTVSLAMAAAAVGAASWATGWTPRELAPAASSRSLEGGRISLKDPRSATELKWVRSLPAAESQHFERQAERYGGNSRGG